MTPHLGYRYWYRSATAPQVRVVAVREAFFRDRIIVRRAESPRGKTFAVYTRELRRVKWPARPRAPRRFTARQCGWVG